MKRLLNYPTKTRTRTERPSSARSIAQNGFTLTELIMVIVIMGIIGAVITPLLGNKFSAVSQSAERAGWVQQAEYALFHIQRDLASSVPNSVYTSEPISGAAQVVEFLGVDPESSGYAARYRDKQLNGYDRLQPNNDSSFDVFANIPLLTNFASYVSIGTQNPTNMIVDWQSINGSGTSGTIAKVRAATNSANSSETGGPLTNVILSAAHNFGGHSPFYRAYFFNGPVAYQCDLTDGVLYRVSSYVNLGTTNFATRTATAVKSRIVSNVTACEFEMVGGSVYLPPSIKVTLAIGNASESIHLINTIVLSNGS